jgi:AcrR family transcriptional regulator
MPRTKSISDDDILDQALPFMASAGPMAFTLAGLAKQLGLAPATLVQRFGDKQSLIEKAFARDNDRFLIWIETLPAGVGANVVIKIYSDATKLFGDNPRLADHLLWLREDIRDPTMNRLALARFKILRAAIVKRLPAMRISANDAARLLDAQYHGAVIQWALEPKGRLDAFITRSLKNWFRLAGH